MGGEPIKIGNLPIDREIAALVRDINQLSGSSSYPLADQEKELSRLQSNLLEAHVEFTSIYEETCELLRDAGSEESGASDSAVYWNSILLEKLFALYDRQNQLLRRQLWSEILAARVQYFEGYLPKWLEDEGAVGLGQRRTVQESAEKSLMKRTAVAKERQQQIDQQLSAIAVGIANRDAAGSLNAYFGDGNSKLWEHHYMIALELYLKKLTLPLRLGGRYLEVLRASRDFQDATKAHKDNVKRSLFERFARRGATKEDRPTPDRKTAKQSQVLAARHGELQRYVHQALRQSPPKARLLVVKSASPLPH